MNVQSKTGGQAGKRRPVYILMNVQSKTGGQAGKRRPVYIRMNVQSRPSWTGKHGKGLNALQLPIVGTYLTPALHTLLPREKRKGPSHLKAKRARLIFVN
jgi:hypothetical protein